MCMGRPICVWVNIRIWGRTEQSHAIKFNLKVYERISVHINHQILYRLPTFPAIRHLDGLRLI